MQGKLAAVFGIGDERERPQVLDRVLDAFLFQRRQPLVKSALRRFKASRLRALIVEAARVDASLKGVFPAEPWTTLTDLLVSLLRPAEGARAR